MIAINPFDIKEAFIKLSGIKKCPKCDKRMYRNTRGLFFCCNQFCEDYNDESHRSYLTEVYYRNKNNVKKAKKVLSVVIPLLIAIASLWGGFYLNHLIDRNGGGWYHVPSMITIFVVGFSGGMFFLANLFEL